MIAFESFGARIGVELPDSWTGGELLSRFPPRSNRIRADDLHTTYRVGEVSGSRRKGREDERWRVTAGDDLIDIVSDRERAAKLLAHELNFAVARHARDWIFVHAGVVAHRGDLLMFPGPTGTGKSTLVRALVEEGATYYSDDLAPVDEHGRVHAFPRSLRLRSGRGFRELPDPDAERERPPQRPSRIYFLEHRSGVRGTGDWRPTSSGRALLLLLQETVHAKIRPERSIDYLQRAIDFAGCWVGDRGEAQKAARRALGSVSNDERVTERPGDYATREITDLESDSGFETAARPSPAASPGRAEKNS